jgi:predicted Zn finger-like uncharacterized protein
MFTVCSKCNLRLTVTAQDLRAAQGYVRCGRCHNVFNALAALADDPARQAVPASVADTQQRPVLTQPEPPGPSATDAALEFNPASTNINEVFIEAAAGEGSGTFESIILEGEEPAPAPAEPDHTPPAAPPPGAAPPPPEEPVALEEPAAPEAAPGAALDPQTPGVDWSGAAEVASAVEEPPEAALLKPPRAAARLPGWALPALAGVLAVGLAAQGVHHYRAELAATALLHGPLSALYQTLGLPLAPRWNITDYEIRQLGAITDGAAGGELLVRASISNHATHDQPLPLLRIVMQDRFGNRVAGRDLRPAEYLGPGAPPVSLMRPGQRVDVQVALRDPGQAATGFEVDACMAGRDHTVTCANDPGGH